MIGIKIKKNRIEFILFILGIIGIIIFKVFDNKDNKTIFNNQGFAIGVLTQFDPAKSYVSWVPNAKQLTINSPTVKFTYSVNDRTFTVNYGTDTYPIISELAIIGKKYLVVFNKNKPKSGRILLNYPIIDSTDFKRVTKTFALDPARFKVK